MRDYTAQPVPASVWKNPYHFVAFGFGSGAAPFAPGTFGTLMAIPFYLAMRPLSPFVYLLLVIAIIISSMWLCEKGLSRYDVCGSPWFVLDFIRIRLISIF